MALKKELVSGGQEGLKGELPEWPIRYDTDGVFPCEQGCGRPKQQVIEPPGRFTESCRVICKAFSKLGGESSQIFGVDRDREDLNGNTFGRLRLCSTWLDDHE